MNQSAKPSKNAGDRKSLNTLLEIELLRFYKYLLNKELVNKKSRALQIVMDYMIDVKRKRYKLQ